MQTDFLTLATFVLVTTFTPGPNNIAAAAMGVLHGYRRTLNFLAGIAVGFFLMIQVSAWVSGSLLEAFPALQEWLRYVGAGYILYLAYATLKTSYGFDAEGAEPLRFANGFLLQLLNPKLIVYGLTLFGTFLAGLRGQFASLLLAAAVLSAVSFAAISPWAPFGSAIRNSLRDARVQRVVNSVLALLLVYTALDLAGLL